MNVIAENNKAIAYFMGNFLEKTMSEGGLYNNQYHNFPIEHSCYLSELLYHSSWDWLMPVVSKIYTDSNEEIQQFEGLGIFEMPISAEIEDVYSEVVEFIKWYNENKPQNPPEHN